MALNNFETQYVERGHCPAYMIDLRSWDEVDHVFMLIDRIYLDDTPDCESPEPHKRWISAWIYAMDRKDANPEMTFEDFKQSLLGIFMI